MTLKEFQPQAIRTLAELGSRLMNSIHMTLGMGSELLKELLEAIRKEDHVNTAEELGDTQWFAVVYCHIWNIDINQTLIDEKLKNGRGSLLDGFLQALGHLQELDKNELAYKREVPADDPTRIKAIHTILAFTESTAEEFDISMVDVRTKIINKLKVRFPEKFSEEHANVRDLHAERKALES